MLFIGVSGRTYETDLYVSDVDKAKVQFDQGAGAGVGSGDYWRTPERGVLSDLSFVTGPTVIMKCVLILNGRRRPDMFRLDTHVSTAPTRPPIRIKVDRNVDIGLIQTAD